MDPRAVVVAHDGLRLAALDWGGTGEPLALLHPNGLCAGFFDPLARRLTDTFRVVAVDLPGHGGSDAPPSREGLRFAAMAAGVVAVLDALGIDELVVLGESLGGGVAVLVDAHRPGALRHAVLCEAIAFDASRFRRAASLGERGSGNAMAELARARRAVWPDREVVRHRYSTRPPFDVLAPEALEAYLRFGFFDRPDGQVELACAPETEAAVFEVSAEPGGAPSAFAHLPALAGRASVLHGAGSYLPRAWFEAQADAVGTRLVTVPGGHLFLQEHTARAEALVREVLGR